MPAEKHKAPIGSSINQWFQTWGTRPRGSSVNTTFPSKLISVSRRAKQKIIFIIIETRTSLRNQGQGIKFIKKHCSVHRRRNVFVSTILNNKTRYWGHLSFIFVGGGGGGNTDNSTFNGKIKLTFNLMNITINIII